MHSKRRIIAASIIAAAALALMALYVLVISPKLIEPAESYQKAVALYNKGDYLNAALQLNAIKGYQDAGKLAQIAWKEAGNAAFTAGRYSEALSCYEQCDEADRDLGRVDECFVGLAEEAFAAGNIYRGEICLNSVRDKAALTGRMDRARLNGAVALLAGEGDEANRLSQAIGLTESCGASVNRELGELFFDYGARLLEIPLVDEAALAFETAKGHGGEDMASRINEEWKAAWARAMQAGDSDTAERCEQMIEGGVDPAEVPGNDDDKYRSAEALFENGDPFAALVMLNTVENATAETEELRNTVIAFVRGIANAGGSSAYALLAPDGKVELVGSGWPEDAGKPRGAKAIAVGMEPFVLVLRADGSVEGFGYAGTGRLETGEWTDIVAVACGAKHSIGLRSDGTVVACGFNMYGQGATSYWANIESIACGSNTSYGVNRSGRAYAIGDNGQGQCEVSDWQDIVMIAAGRAHAVGLTADGKAVACGSNEFGQCDVSNWNGLVYISCGAEHTVGLTSDGTLVACGNNATGACDVQGFTDVLAVSCGDGYTLVVLADGSVEVVGSFDTEAE